MRVTNDSEATLTLIVAVEIQQLEERYKCAACKQWRIHMRKAA